MIVAKFNVLFWCPVLLATAVFTLTIDAQLGTSIEDCFERISIGEQLPPDAIYRNITELTTRECEQLCKQDKQCQTYDYGVGAKGNATCNLSTLGEKELQEQNLFQRHPDYDVYIRRFQCEQAPPTPIQPQSDEEIPPLHRPVFRPDEDELKHPLSDDYLSDLRPFETQPVVRPSRPYGPRPYTNHIESDRPDDYDNSSPDFDRPPSYGAHTPPDIPYRPEPYIPERPVRPHDPYRPERPIRPNIPYRPERPLRPSGPYGTERPLRPDEPYRPERPLRPNAPYEPQRPLRPEDPYKPERPDDPYRPETPDEPYRPLRPENPYRPQSPLRPEDPYRPQKPYRPGYNEKPYNQSHFKPDPYDELQFQDHYGRPPRPNPGAWRPDPHYPFSPYDEIPDLYGPKPIRPQKPSYKPEEPEYHYVVNPNKKPQSQILKPQDEGYNKPAQDPYKPNKPDYESNRPDPYLPNQPDPYPETGYGNKPGHNQPNKPNGYKPKPDPYGPGPVGPPDRPYRPSRPYDYTPSRPYEKPSYNYNSQYASGYGQSQDNSIYVEIYDPPRPYKPMKPLNNKPDYSSQGYGQNFGYGSYESHSNNAYGYPHNSHLYYGTQSGLYGQNYNRPTEEDIDEKPHYSHGASGGSMSQSFDQSSGYGNQKPPHRKPSYGGNQGSYGQGDYNNNQYGGQNYGSNRPSYGPNKPSYGFDHDKPSYGNNQEKPPSYGSAEEKPAYGGSQEKPSYGGNQDYDGNRPYSNQNTQKPQKGNQKPSYGSSQDNNENNIPENSYSNQNYGSNNSYKPGYQKPGNETNYRPDVRPVYEYELEKPSNVPSYIVGSSGDVVTSRPVTIGDYEKPGYGEKPGYEAEPGYGERPEFGDAGYRDPGKLGSYKGNTGDGSEFHSLAVRIRKDDANPFVRMNRIPTTKG